MVGRGELGGEGRGGEGADSTRTRRPQRPAAWGKSVRARLAPSHLCILVFHEGRLVLAGRVAAVAHPRRVEGFARARQAAGACVRRQALVLRRLVLAPAPVRLGRVLHHEGVTLAVALDVGASETVACVMVAQPMAAHARVLVLADAAADGRAGVAFPHRPQGKRLEELHGLLASESAAVDLLGDVADELPEILRLPGTAGGLTTASSRRRCTRRLIHERGRRRVHEKVSRCRDLGKALRGFLDILRIAVGVPAHGKLLERGGDHLGIGRAAVSPELDAEHLGGLLQQRRHFGVHTRCGELPLKRPRGSRDKHGHTDYGTRYS